MAEPERGTKRVCQSCPARFYDLGRSPIVCPSCGTVFDLELFSRTRVPGGRGGRLPSPDEDLVTEEAEALGVETDAEELDEEVAAEEDETAVRTEDGQEEDDSLIEDRRNWARTRTCPMSSKAVLDEEEQR